MLKNAHISQRRLLPLALAIPLLIAFVPIALVATHAQSPSHLFGPKQHYLALGDSLAYGFQPCIKNNTCSKTDGYVYDLFQTFQNEGTKDVTNYGCPSESSVTFINGGCPFAPPGSPAQLTAALAYLQANAGKVSPVTLDIGVNDVEPDVTIAPNDCTVSSNFDTDLATLDNNLTKTILPQLQAALTVNGRVTGSIVMMNYYDAFQNICQGPASAQFIQDFNTFNTHLANDVSNFGTIVDVFAAFGGATTPNPNICTYTWMCTPPPLGPDIHPMSQGYSVIADTFAAAIPAN